MCKTRGFHPLTSPTALPPGYKTGSCFAKLVNVTPWKQIQCIFKYCQRFHHINSSEITTTSRINNIIYDEKHFMVERHVPPSSNCKAKKLWVRHHASPQRNHLLMYIKQSEGGCGLSYETEGQKRQKESLMMFFWSSFIPEVLGNTYWWSPNCLAWRENAALHCVINIH